ncbi:SAG1386/EF1546 family surface-associated protein [Streptococcus ovuberis]|uniref:LysM peptidoglycan-binding domain-containing protein n=1 Tax=Streptococcus ovuberis TaxID=1936207 RepID=A0A7X6N2F7_9STRE|nr:SAG1386/EF1546 family surface-associated protein [Streptococcus ovuberis]NKZ20904.1 LysM peptidoglycan-binding domain-containing protein [Streptococcus ovuberis]
MASKKPWERKLFDGAGKRSSRNRAKDRTGLIFSILAIAFAIIVTFIIGFSIYLSIGGSKSEQAKEAFYQAGAPASAPAAEEATPPPAEEIPAESTEPSSSSTGATLEVLPGEGAGQIAARAGITIERLYELNPEHLQTGAWYANPGDIVRID